MLRTVVQRIFKPYNADAEALMPVHLGVVLPQGGLHLITSEAFAEAPKCGIHEKPSAASWRLLKQVVHGPLFSDEVLACTATVAEQRFVAAVGVIHINCVMRYDQDLLVPVGAMMGMCDPEVATAIMCMQKLVDQFAEAHRL